MACFVVRASAARISVTSASVEHADGDGSLGRHSGDLGCGTDGPPTAGARSNRNTIEASETGGGRCSMVVAHGLDCTMGHVAQTGLRSVTYPRSRTHPPERFARHSVALSPAE